MAFSSKNAFALLGDEDGPAPVAAAPKAAAPAAPAAAPARNVVGSGRGAPRGGAAGGARGGQRAPRNAEGAAAGGADDAQQTRELREPRRGRGDGRGRGRGGRGAKGGRLDRHSATDRVDSDKNIHQGWGGDDGKRELKNEEDAAADASAEAKPANGDSTPATVEGEEAAAPAAEAAPVEEVDNTKTLDEYLADLAAKKTVIGGKTVAPRAVESGSWEGFGNKVVKSQSGGDEFYAATKQASAGKQRERKEKQLLEIEQTFNQPAVASRGGRGGARGGRGDFGGRGRGEGRGRGGRGSARGARGGNAGANVSLNDTRAFPSLS